MRVIPSASLALLLGLGALGAVAPTASQAQIGINVSVGFAPPPLPIYDQPPIPGYGYMWTPGYWAWDSYYGDYYWVPGTWVQPPRIGYLWTPGYWAWQNGLYLFNTGYWGQQIGYYGGIDYGYGYGGYGYGGGQWRGRDFYYNRSVNNMSNARIANVYNAPAVVRGGRTSFNGGAGGVQARPRPEELAAAREARVAATPAQRRQVQLARNVPGLRASVNHGAPVIAATSRAGVLHGAGVVRASPASATYRPPVGARLRPAASAPLHGGGYARPEARPNVVNRAVPAPGGYRAGLSQAPHQQAPHQQANRPQAPRPSGGGHPAPGRPGEPH